MIHLVPMTLVSNNEELSKYFNHNKYYQFFERCIGLCPTGWSYSKIANTKTKSTTTTTTKRRNRKR